MAVYFNIPALKTTLEALQHHFKNLDILVGGHAFIWGGTGVLKNYPGTMYLESLAQLETEFINSSMRLSPAQSQVILEYFEDDAPILFFLLDDEGVIQTVNRYCSELLGPAIIGQNFSELLVDFQQSFQVRGIYSKGQSHSS